MANRIDDIDESNSDLVNPDAFLSDIKLAHDSIPDIELCDLGNEIGWVIASLNLPHRTLLRETIYGIEHGFELIGKGKRALSE